MGNLNRSDPVLNGPCNAGSGAPRTGAPCGRPLNAGSPAPNQGNRQTRATARVAPTQKSPVGAPLAGALGCTDAPATTTPSFAVPESGVLANLHQVRLYLRSKGWRVSYDKLKKDAEERGALKARRGGGWTVAAAEKYARAHVSKGPDESEDLDAAFGDDVAAGSVAERRILADAKLKEWQGARAALALEKDRGRLISRDRHEQELAARLAFFSNQLDVYAAQSAEEVIYSLCGSNDQAGQLCALAKGDPSAVPDLLAWFQRRIPEIVEMLLARRQAWLGAFASGSGPESGQEQP